MIEMVKVTKQNGDLPMGNKTIQSEPLNSAQARFFISDRLGFITAPNAGSPHPRHHHLRPIISLQLLFLLQLSHFQVLCPNFESWSNLL